MTSSAPAVRSPDEPAARTQFKMNSVFAPTPCTPSLPAAVTHARILVVDDDEAVLDLEAEILRHAGHCVAVAAGGATAWKALLAGSYDLLVTDYLMPGGSGLALVRQMRVADILLPVVLVTGSLDLLDTAKLRRDPWSRIHGFVRKPFTFAQLLAAVQSALAPADADTESFYLKPA